MFSNVVFNAPSVHPGKSWGPVVVLGKRKETITHCDSSSGTSTSLTVPIYLLCAVSCTRTTGRFYCIGHKRETLSKNHPTSISSGMHIFGFQYVDMRCTRERFQPKTAPHASQRVLDDDVCVLTSNSESNKVDEKAVDNLAFGLGDDF